MISVQQGRICIVDKPYEVEIMFMKMVPNTVVARIRETELKSVVADFAESKNAKDFYIAKSEGNCVEFWLEFAVHDAHELVEELRAELYRAWLEIQ
jgi:hypothetical protein